MRIELTRLSWSLRTQYSEHHAKAAKDTELVRGHLRAKSRVVVQLHDYLGLFIQYASWKGYMVSRNDHERVDLCQECLQLEPARPGRGLRTNEGIGSHRFASIEIKMGLKRSNAIRLPRDIER